MITDRIFFGFPARHGKTATCGRWNFREPIFGDHRMVTAAPAVEMPTVSTRPDHDCSAAHYQGLSPRQQMALRLDDAGHTQSAIAKRLGLGHRESATRLIHRARKAAEAFRAAVEAFLD
jgi:hypothetical protein